MSGFDLVCDIVTAKRKPNESCLTKTVYKQNLNWLQLKSKLTQKFILNRFLVDRTVERQTKILNGCWNCGALLYKFDSFLFVTREKKNFFIFIGQLCFDYQQNSDNKMTSSQTSRPYLTYVAANDNSGWNEMANQMHLRTLTIFRIETLKGYL